jgi:hypothetical protein
MSTCRVARRVASIVRWQNTCADAGCAQSLATKVFHYPCQHFLPWAGRRRAVESERRIVVGPLSTEQRSREVRSFLPRGGACRLASWLAPITTSCINSPLVTKEKNGGLE